jgi:hypothetical protein
VRFGWLNIACRSTVLYLPTRYYLSVTTPITTNYTNSTKTTTNSFSHTHTRVRPSLARSTSSGA